jgi:hypothetical protein
MWFQLAKFRVTTFVPITCRDFTNRNFSRRMRGGCGWMRLIQPIDPATARFVWQPPRIHPQGNRRILMPHLAAHVRHRLTRVDEQRTNPRGPGTTWAGRRHPRPPVYVHLARLPAVADRRADPGRTRRAARALIHRRSSRGAAAHWRQKRKKAGSRRSVRALGRKHWKPPD